MSEFPEKIWLADDGDELTRHAPVYDFWYSGEPDFTDVKSGYIRSDLVPQWQPIETMPEGMEVLLRHFDEDNYVGQIKIMSGRKFIDTYGAISVISNFTHWMPIPKVPE